MKLVFLLINYAKFHQLISLYEKWVKFYQLGEYKKFILSINFVGIEIELYVKINFRFKCHRNFDVTIDKLTENLVKKTSI
ncbi:hypothetical protein TW85_21435 [Marinomonas sp. S3726]|nr:hypothetical protein TW85_21435 [Marinomonas sp. S3726]